MKPRTASRLAWSLFAQFVGLSLAATVLQAMRTTLAIEDHATFLSFVALAGLGALMASRRPDNRLGWLFSIAAYSAAAAFIAEEYARYAIVTDPGSLPAPAYVGWVGLWAWFPAIGIVGTFLLLLFPTGRLPSRRWRPVAWLCGAVIGSLTLVFALSPEPIVSGLRSGPSNPFAIPGLGDAALGAIESLAFPMLGVLVLVCALSVVVRFRSAHGDERQQLKLFTFAAALLSAGIGLGFVLPSTVADLAFTFGLASLPVATALAILRYRLYDIDVVISKTVVYGALAAFVTLVYLGLVVGIGALVGSRGNVLLSIAATGLIAVAFQPVRERARHLANRLVYGKRATPYEVLSEFSDRVATSYAADDILSRMARLVGEGTGAAEAGVWLAVDKELRASAAWPTDALLGRTLPLADGEIPTLDGVERAYPVRHQGELLGALTVTKPRAEPITPAEDKLLADLSAQAGLVLRNVKLIEELRASRQRIVSAQDEERRRLERNIHDGAQQQLVALTVKMRLVQVMAGKDPAKTAELAEQAKGELQDALDDLRDLARGIYPPLLADQGLAAALEAQGRKAAVPVEVHPDGVGRYSQEVEAGAYFCVLEALQNIAKYAEASRVDVSLRSEDGVLLFEVRDDGKGFDPAVTSRGSGLQNMADRLDALGGSVEIESEPGSGTSVRGRIPVQPVAAAHASESRSGSNSDLGM